MSTPAPDPARPRPVQRPDDLDLRLLALLQQDPRASLRALARQAGVAPGTVAERRQAPLAGRDPRGRPRHRPRRPGVSLEVLLGVSVAAETPLATLVQTLLDVPWVREVHAVAAAGTWS